VTWASLFEIDILRSRPGSWSLSLVSDCATGYGFVVDNDGEPKRGALVTYDPAPSHQGRLPSIDHQGARGSVLELLAGWQG
jgi:hypothetical protein